MMGEDLNNYLIPAIPFLFPIYCSRKHMFLPTPIMVF